MRRFAPTVLLLAAGAGLLLTGALAPAASAQAGTVTVANPGNQSGVTGTVITPLQLHATDTDMVAAFAWTAGSLPVGLVISPTTGLITGTPVQAGTYSVTVTAVESTTMTPSPSASMTTPVATPTPSMTTPSASATATKPATASAFFTPFGQTIFDWVITGTAAMTPTAAPTAFPSGGVVTGGGGSLSGGASAGLAAAGAALILAAGGTLAWRRRKSRLS